MRLDVTVRQAELAAVALRNLAEDLQRSGVNTDLELIVELSVFRQHLLRAIDAEAALDDLAKQQEHHT